MKLKRVLVTGGAGFIGSHLADELLEYGYGVRVLDNLSEQVNGPSGRKPAYLSAEAEFMKGDVRDREAVKKALDGVDAVYHFAAAVGVGQSMYEIAAYTSVNNMGTAVLLECLMARPVEKLVVASSMSVYGEGLYKTRGGRLCETAERGLEQLKSGIWEALAEDGEPLEPLPTPEWKKPSLSSVYALSKYDQERLCLMTGKAYGYPVTALRFFNVYGSRQALSNPYTGVLTIFASRLVNGNPPVIYEDGLQMRDFVNVRDVARACRLALEKTGSDQKVINVGSGRPRSIRDVARQMALASGKQSIEPEVRGKYRVGDIRHCFADIGLAESVIGYSPRVGFEEGLAEFAEWLKGQAADDHTVKANTELLARGLMV